MIYSDVYTREWRKSMAEYEAKRLKMTDTKTIDATLAERGSRYGKFEGHAAITQALKEVMHGASIPSTQWDSLPDTQREALEMIAHKIGRILNPGADFNYDDNYRDIAGYAELVVKQLNGKGV